MRDLVPIHSRLDRAQTHFDDLHSAVNDAMRAGHYGVSRQTYRQGAKHLYNAVVREGFLEFLSLYASDCLHNLRSTLDNLIYRLAETHFREKDQAVPDQVAKVLAFPICTDANHFAEAQAGHRLDGLDSAELEVVRRHQPYNRSDVPDESPLWALRELQDIDKHRFLLRLRSAPGDWGAYVPPPGCTVVLTPLEGFYDLEGVKDGVPMAEFSVDPPNPDFDLEFDPRLSIFAQWGTGRWKDVTEVLRTIRGAVHGVVWEMEQLP